MRCQAVKSDGAKCSAFAVKGSRVCFLHGGDGRRAVELGRKGGSRRTIRKPLKRLPATRNAKDVCALVSQCIGELRGGLLDARLANALFCGASILLKALQTAEIEMRLQRLEAADAARSKRRLA